MSLQILVFKLGLEICPLSRLATSSSLHCIWVRLPVFLVRPLEAAAYVSSLQGRQQEYACGMCLGNHPQLRKHHQNLLVLLVSTELTSSSLVLQSTISELWAVPHLKSDKMAAIPSSGSLVATHDYYRREWGGLVDFYFLNCSNRTI